MHLAIVIDMKILNFKPYIGNFKLQPRYSTSRSWANGASMVRKIWALVSNSCLDCKFHLLEPPPSKSHDSATFNNHNLHISKHPPCVVRLPCSKAYGVQVRFTCVAGQQQRQDQVHTRQLRIRASRQFLSLPGRSTQ